MKTETVGSSETWVSTMQHEYSVADDTYTNFLAHLVGFHSHWSVSDESASHWVDPVSCCGFPITAQTIWWLFTKWTTGSGNRFFFQAPRPTLRTTQPPVQWIMELLHRE